MTYMVSSFVDTCYVVLGTDTYATLRVTLSPAAPWPPFQISRNLPLIPWTLVLISQSPGCSSSIRWHHSILHSAPSSLPSIDRIEYIKGLDPVLTAVASASVINSYASKMIRTELWIIWLRPLDWCDCQYYYISEARSRIVPATRDDASQWPSRMKKRKGPYKTYTSLWVYSNVRVLRAYMEAQVQAISASRRAYYTGLWMKNWFWKAYGG